MGYISHIKLPDGTSYDINAKTVNGQSLGWFGYDSTTQIYHMPDGDIYVGQNYLVQICQDGHVTVRNVAGDQYVNISDQLVRIYNGGTKMDIGASDIDLVGSTWDGTNTSLTGAFASILNSRSYVGMIIHSTTLNTEAKVKAQYGGNSWIRHSGYVLRGASSGVTADSAASDGGADSVSYTPAGSNAAVKLTAAQSGMPSHSHGSSNSGEQLLSTSSSGEGVSRRTQASGSGATNTLFSGYAVNRITSTNSKSASASESHNHTFTGTKATIHTLPKYKSVYIWERVS